MFPEFSIKLYAWEHAFLRRVLFVRNEEELKMLRKIGIFTVRICQLMGSLPNSYCILSNTGHEHGALDWHSVYVALLHLPS
jgi:hypothetical protein